MPIQHGKRTRACKRRRGQTCAGQLTLHAPNEHDWTALCALLRQSGHGSRRSVAMWARGQGPYSACRAFQDAHPSPLHHSARDNNAGVVARTCEARRTDHVGRAHMQTRGAALSLRTITRTLVRQQRLVPLGDLGLGLCPSLRLLRRTGHLALAGVCAGQQLLPQCEKASGDGMLTQPLGQQHMEAAWLFVVARASFKPWRDTARGV